VKVTVADVLGQMLTFDAMVTVGGGITVIVTEPDAGTVQPGEPGVATFTSAIVVVDA
jgi:hypothetical protein